MKQELLGLFVQAFIFIGGLVFSVGAGMVCAARTDNPGPLLIITVLAGVGLLGFAALSQVARERIVDND